MKTKKYLIILTTLLTAIIFNSCKDFLTEDPPTQITAEKYFRSAADLRASMAGLYSSFRQEMTGGGSNATFGKYHFWGEIRSDNFDRSGYGGTDANEMTLNQLTSGNYASNWSGLYRTIARANINLKYFPTVLQYDNTVNEDTVNNYLAQCYAIRAMCYFYLVRVWGDAPVWTEPYADLTQQAERAQSPKDSIMNFVIIPDLLNAYDLIRKNQATKIWIISEASIAAILADVYMWNRDYTNALTWFGNLFRARNQLNTGTYAAPASATDSSKIAKAIDWKNIFLAPQSSIEAIWSIYFDNPSNENSPNVPPAVATINNSGYRVDSTIYDSPNQTVGWLGSGDRRARQTVSTAGWGNLLKFHPQTGATRANPVYLVMYRLSDMYLLYAEALNQTGNQAAAINIVNLMRFRARVPLATAPSGWAVPDVTLAVEDTILYERRWELFGEGKRWFDLVRTFHVNRVMKPILQQRLRRFYGESYNPNLPFESYELENRSTGTMDPREYWPINRTVLFNNKALVQNFPYN